MKQISQSYKTGELHVVDVPEPQAGAGSVRVHTTASLLSAGTERTIVELARKSLLGKARERPDLVGKVLAKAQREGVLAAFEAVRSRLDSPIPLGYSLAGRVAEVGAGITDLVRGDRVACAGAGFANHAEVNVVPRNLVARVPDDVTDEEASFVTVGAIALHGVRLLRPALGETIVVIGLGLLGQIAVQLLVASGCEVVGVDVNADRVRQALARGARASALIGADEVAEVVRAATNGRGADGVLITASATDNAPLALAGEVARDRATVSVVGLLPLEIPRKEYYEKELKVVVSRSYGPGRYDPTYELAGNDYPIGYVRWTLGRNMDAVLGAIATKRLDVASLVTHRFAFDSAIEAYDLITGKVAEPHMGVVLTYASVQPTPPAVTREPAVRASHSMVRVGLVGAGAFATSVLLPELAKAKGARLVAVASARGLSAQHAAARYGAEVAGSLDDVLERADVDAVVIATRHVSHAAMAAQALATGRDVFLEKPAAIDAGQLEELDRAVRGASGRLMVGFNRRFAPFATVAHEALVGRSSGLVMVARINAGRLGKGHWVAERAESGGRIVGEACHFVDLMTYWAGAPPITVSAHAIARGPSGERADNVVVGLEFADGSVGTIVYTSMGDAAVGKEQYEIFCEGVVVRIDDWRKLSITRAGKTRVTRALRSDKGHGQGLQAFVDACASGAASPISWESISATTRATFAVDLAWANRVGVRLD